MHHGGGSPLGGVSDSQVTDTHSLPPKLVAAPSSASPKLHALPRVPFCVKEERRGKMGIFSIVEIVVLERDCLLNLSLHY